MVEFLTQDRGVAGSSLTATGVPSIPCVLEQDTLILAFVILATGSTLEDLFRHNRKIVDWD